MHILGSMTIYENRGRYEIMWKNVAQSDYNIIGRIYFACWKIVATFFFYRGHPVVFMNLKHIVIFPSNITTFILFRNDNMFWSKKTIIRPSLKKL